MKEIKKEVRMLLENFWIDRVQRKEEYFQIRRAENEIRKFFTEKLGWRLISNEKIIKLEKIPAKTEAFMGIESFTEKLDYCILCGLLIFLEEKEDGQQFLLHEIIESIEFYLKDYIDIDWLKITHRKSLIRAFKFAEEMRIIAKTEGDIKSFGEDKETEVLYEKTELSRYFSINFNRDISSFNSYKDFEREKEEEIDTDKGDIRTNRVYRKLLTTPAVYWKDFNDADRIYIKNQKPTLESNIEKLIDGKLHIHKNGAFLIFDNKKEIGKTHPGKAMLSEIVLLVCGELRKRIEDGELKKAFNDLVYISEKEMKDIINMCRKKYSVNWSKEYREITEEKLFISVIEYMESWMFAARDEKGIMVYPGTGKIVGIYKERQRSAGGIDE